jgi:hypothetical protein
MAQAIDTQQTSCPLCREPISLDLPSSRATGKWRDALVHRQLWAAVSDEFRQSQSIEKAAARLSITPEAARLILEFLCLKVCGCRAVTCVSCLDDYRSAL